MKAFLKENYIKILILILLALLFILWARVTGAQVQEHRRRNHLDTNDARVECLLSYGWQVDPQPAETSDYILPGLFDDVLIEYNALQKLSGFDLLPYRGKQIIRYTYRVLNFPVMVDEPVYANLLLCGDRLIGGDLMTADLGGFMLPLDPQQAIGAP